MHDTLKFTARDPAVPQVGAERDHVLDAVRLHRELHPAVLARRGRPRQAIDARQDAGRRVAEGREPARAVRASCTRTPARSCSSWATSSASGASGTTRASLDWDLLDAVRCTRACCTLVRDLNRIYTGEPALSSATTICRASSGSTAAITRTASIAFLRRGAERRRSSCRRVQLDAGRARGLPHRRAASPATGRVLLNTDAAAATAARARARAAAIETEPIAAHGFAQSIALTLPPLGACGPRTAEARPAPLTGRPRPDATDR